MAKVNQDLAAIETRSQDRGPGDTQLSSRNFAPNIAALTRARQIGTFDQQAGTIGKFDPTRISYLQKYFMSRTDTMIRLGLHYTKVPLINAPFHFECEDPQVAAVVDAAYRRIHVRLMLAMLTSLDFGFAPVIKNFKQIDPPAWKYEDENGNEKKAWPSKLKPVVWGDPDVLPPYGAEPKFKADDRTFDGIKHPMLTSPSSPNGLDVPVEYALWITNERESVFGDWYGWPATAPAFRYWWSYWYRWLMGDRHFEADADPPIVVYGPPDEKYPDPRDPTREITSQELGLLIAESVRNGSSMFMPSDTYLSEIDGRTTGTPKWRIDVLRGAENMQVFNDSFAYADTMKLRAMLVPEQALIQGDQPGAGKSAATTYGQAFAESLGLKSGELDQAINDWLIPDLVKQNFVDAPECRKVTTGFREEDLESAKNLITILAQQDLQSMDIDVRKLVKSVGIPQISADRAKKMREEAMGPGSNFAPGAGTASDQGPLPPGTPAAGTDTTAGAAAQAGSVGGSTPAGDGGQPGSGLQVVGFALPIHEDMELPEGFPGYRDEKVQEIAATLFTEIDAFLDGLYTDSVDVVHAAMGEPTSMLELDGRWTPSLHPRWPGKAAGGKGGEFMEVSNILQRLGNSLSGSMNVGFLARGARNIRGVNARRHGGDSVSFDVTLGDGRKGSIIADTNTEMSKIVDALQRVDDGSIKNQIRDAESAAKAAEQKARDEARQAKKVEQRGASGVRNDVGAPSPDVQGPTPGEKEIQAMVDLVENDSQLSTWPPPKGEVARKVLGDFRSTRELWTDSRGRYSSDRKELHDRILDSFLSGHTRQSEQTVLFTAGGPASGKSTGGNNPDGDILPPDAVRVDMDLIRTWLPEYRMMRPEHDSQGNVISLGDPAIASSTHDEATDIARELVRRARENRLNVVIDGTGTGNFEGKMRTFKDAGYRVEAAMFDVPTDKAVQRAIVRGHMTGRLLPPKFVRDKHRAAAQAHLGWRDSDAIDQWRAYSTDVAPGEPVIKIAEGGGGEKEPTIHDPERYGSLVAKAGKQYKSKSSANYDSYQEPLWLKGDGSSFSSGPVVAAGAGVPKNKGVQQPRDVPQFGGGERGPGGISTHSGMRAHAARERDRHYQQQQADAAERDRVAREAAAIDNAAADAQAAQIQTASPSDFQAGDAVYNDQGDWIGKFVGIGPDGRVIVEDGGVRHSLESDLPIKRKGTK